MAAAETARGATPRLDLGVRILGLVGGFAAMEFAPALGGVWSHLAGDCGMAAALLSWLGLSPCSRGMCGLDTARRPRPEGEP